MRVELANESLFPNLEIYSSHVKPHIYAQNKVRNLLSLEQERDRERERDKKRIEREGDFSNYTSQKLHLYGCDVLLLSLSFFNEIFVLSMLKIVSCESVAKKQKPGEWCIKYRRIIHGIILCVLLKPGESY